MHINKRILMNLGIFGYGKMGQKIEELAPARGHNISFIANNAEFTALDLQVCDAIIEFTTPESVIQNIDKALEAKVPIIVGTTAWQQHLTQVTQKVENENGSLFYASNFSIGVNIMFAMNEKLAQIMNNYSEYVPSLEEWHHANKIDAPSGTAVTLCDGIINHSERIKQYALDAQSEENTIGVIAHRENDIKGIHEVKYTSQIDQISLRHEAFNRNGFALGAILAAEWLTDKIGVYTMKDMLAL